MISATPPRRDLLERVLPIYERDYGSDHAEVAGVLNRLGAPGWTSETTPRRRTSTSARSRSTSTVATVRRWSKC